jgi:hypothetical protein
MDVSDDRGRTHHSNHERFRTLNSDSVSEAEIERSELKQRFRISVEGDVRSQYRDSRLGGPVAERAVLGVAKIDRDSIGDGRRFDLARICVPHTGTIRLIEVSQIREIKIECVRASGR